MRSRLRENMLLGVAMVGLVSFEKCVVCMFMYCRRREAGCIGTQSCYSCLGTGPPLAPGSVKGALIGQNTARNLYTSAMGAL
jgi:hypothetical protein